jgi:hypothetical protein
MDYMLAGRDLVGSWTLLYGPPEAASAPDPSVIPDDFQAYYVTALSDEPHPGVSVHVLNVEALGLADALSWAEAHPDLLKFLALGRTGGDLTPLARHCRGVTSLPDPRLGHPGLRKVAWDLYFAIKNPDYRDPAWDDEPGGVSREEFEEHLRAAADGTGDDGATC